MGECENKSKSDKSELDWCRLSLWKGVKKKTELPLPQKTAPSTLSISGPILTSKSKFPVQWRLKNPDPDGLRLSLPIEL